MTHPPSPRVGLVPLGRTTFDIPLATQAANQVHTELEKAGFLLTGSETLVTTSDEAKSVIQNLSDVPPDVLLILQTTFADSTMALALAREVDAPLLLWAIPEAHTGGRLRLNSLCGINLAGHSLTRAGYRYDYVYAAPGDPAAMEQVRAVALAGRVRRQLRQTRLGRVGEHPTGFDTCRFDALALKNRLGPDVIQIDQNQVFQQVRAIAPQEIDPLFDQLNQRLGNLAELDQPALRGTLGTYLTLRHLAQQQNLAGFAIRCWPEFFTELGCAACGAMSMLSNECIPCSCEADVNGTITQLILQGLSHEPAFGSDLVSVDREKDGVVLWHCGLAPLSMADPSTKPRGTIHSNRQLPLLMEFSLKPGRVTVARLSEATGDYRLVIGGGDMVPAPPSFSGTSGILHFDNPAGQVIDTLLSEGLEHHLTITYGDYVPALTSLAKMLDIPVLRL